MRCDEAVQRADETATLMLRHVKGAVMGIYFAGALLYYPCLATSVAFRAAPPWVYVAIS